MTMGNSAEEADYLTRMDTEVKLPRPNRFKNKTPAPIQITAEQPRGTRAAGSRDPPPSKPPIRVSSPTTASERGRNTKT
ncbi:unnamed protein product [Linum tenue]|uniref:Uncharacterized protein n=1 Tax=Linum tenue TaxID=586396 RepID=A0AAV0I3B8_9ROSI|nr:unnamed protein product [Linum tenue]